MVVAGGNESKPQAFRKLHGHGIRGRPPTVTVPDHWEWDAVTFSAAMFGKDLYDRADLPLKVCEVRSSPPQFVGHVVWDRQRALVLSKTE